ncbi:MAG: type II toxin-antitoxin system HicB family antitoxin [Aphanocapsa sp. GSE-SYN-MK-11-07L]|jgi:predicted RNase H-like HicB family nuclease|nr:type II toxin-antitoxin system HicB family antitoxin [Aphanocapsa sp. GSE-SYN-MK-11-07L]
MVKYRVIIEPDEDGIYVVEVPALPGCISQGQTRTEAIENIKEAIAAYLESLEAHGEPAPPSISEEVVEVARLLCRLSATSLCFIPFGSF